MIDVAVIGAGRWGPHLIRNFDNRQASKVSWVIDRDAARLDEIRARFPDVKTGDNYLSAIDDPSVDAIVVATPTSTHYTLAKAALERKKHVLVEKPIAPSSAEAQELTDLATASDRVLVVGHVFVYNDAIRYVKECISSGTLGRLYYISMVRTNLGPIRTDVNAAWDLAAHDLSVADYWLGDPPVSAAAHGGGWINAGIEDVVFATLRYPNDVLVNLHVSWLNPRKARDITVVGDRKMLTFDDMNLSEPLRIYDKGVAEDLMTPAFADTFASFRASIRDGDVTIPRVPLGEPLLAECMHFLDCIDSGTRPMTGGPEATAVVRTLEAIERSMRNAGTETAIEH